MPDRGDPGARPILPHEQVWGRLAAMKVSKSSVAFVNMNFGGMFYGLLIEWLQLIIPNRYSNYSKAYKHVKAHWIYQAEHLFVSQWQIFWKVLIILGRFLSRWTRQVLSYLKLLALWMWVRACFLPCKCSFPGPPRWLRVSSECGGGRGCSTSRSRQSAPWYSWTTEKKKKNNLSLGLWNFCCRPQQTSFEIWLGG